MANRESEKLKRKRERIALVVVLVLFVLISFSRAYFSRTLDASGFANNFLYFSLLHLNVIFLGLLVFLVVRELVKSFVEKRRFILGANLKWLLVTSILGFSIIPAILLFVGSLWVLQQGVGTWFNVSVVKAFQIGEDLANQFYQDKKYELKAQSSHVKEIFLDYDNPEIIKNYILKTPLYSVSLYDQNFQLIQDFPGAFYDEKVLSLSVESLSFFKSKESHDVLSTAKGDFIRFRGRLDDDKTMVLKYYLNENIKSKMTQYHSRFDDYFNITRLKSEITNNYLLLLVSLFILILFVVVWFGLNIAKLITGPIVDLMKATQEFKKGNYEYRLVEEMKQSRLGQDYFAQTTQKDMNKLRLSFNDMATQIQKKGFELEASNKQLILTVQELEERENNLENLIENIKSGVVVMDDKGKIIKINREAHRLVFGGEKVYHKGSLVGADWKQFFKNSVLFEDIMDWLDDLKLTELSRVDRVFEFKIGEGREQRFQSLKASGIRLKDDHDRVFGFMVLLEDVTDSSRVEKLVAWREVARRVAHEIKNPLTPIKLSSDRVSRVLSKYDLPDSVDQVLKECVGQINKQVVVIRTLVREFSDFAKLKEPELESIDLPLFVDDIAQDYKTTHREIDFNQTESKAIHIMADKEYLRRIFTNLIDNAVDEMTAQAVDEKKLVFRFRDDEDGAFAVCELHDNGQGISADMAKKIFDPYVSSKSTGMGLGLAVVKRVINEMKGRIICRDSNCLNGACFEIHFKKTPS